MNNALLFDARGRGSRKVFLDFQLKYINIVESNALISAGWPKLIIYVHNLSFLVTLFSFNYYGHAELTFSNQLHNFHIHLFMELQV